MQFSLCAFKSKIFLSAVLFISVLIIYFPVLGYGFLHFDDHLYVTQNPFVSRGLTWAGIQWSFLSGGADNWIPLTWLSHMIDVQLFGLKSGGHHFINVLLHGMNSILIFVLFDRMTARRFLSWMIALIFAIHPMHVESVAWIAERKDVLSTFFILLAMRSYVKAQGSEPGDLNPAAISWLRSPASGHWHVVFFFILSLLSKPMYVTFPILLLIIDFWPLGRLQSRRDILKSVVEKAPFFLIAGLVGFVTLYVQKHAGAVFDWSEIAPWNRMLSALMALSNYVQKFIYPVNLSIFYPPFSAKEIAAWGVSSFLVLTGVTIVILTGFFKKHAWVLAGWFIFLVSVIPVLGFVKAGAQAFADRYTYFAFIGLSVMMLWAGQLWIQKKSRLKIPLRALFFVWLGFCVYQTVSRIQDWQSTEKLFQAAVEVHPNNYVAYKVLADDAYARGDLSKASQYLSQTLVVLPPEAESIRGEYELNLAVVYHQLQDWEKALELYQRVSERMPLRVDLVVVIGDIYRQLNQPALARLQYEKALKWLPANEDIQKKLAEVRSP